MKQTFLYIKHHLITDKYYFGKTIKSDPIKYLGSGVHWLRHLKIHGREFVETPWYCLFTDEEEIKKFSLICSEQWDIVKSTKWLNSIPENGKDGFNGTHSLETRLKMSKSRIGGHRSIETREKIRNKLKGNHHSVERCLVNRLSRQATFEIVECPHCGTTGQKFIMGRWHFNNCKKKECAA